MTPLGRVDRAINLRTGREETWYAESRCGQWCYERVEIPGTPWAVTFRPTGHEEWFGSLPAARRWTASSTAVPHLRRLAQDVIDRGGAIPGLVGPDRDSPADRAARVAESMRHIAIIEGFAHELAGTVPVL